MHNFPFIILTFINYSDKSFGYPHLLELQNKYKQTKNKVSLTWSQTFIPPMFLGWELVEIFPHQRHNPYFFSLK